MWLAQSNVPRAVEASCKGPRRLLGIRIQSLSLTEFACEPELSPTSMYLTVPRGKNVSIVCTVTSDPISEITWYFNGRPIEGHYVEKPKVRLNPLTTLRNIKTTRGESFSARKLLTMFNIVWGE